jgi:paxillin
LKFSSSSSFHSLSFLLQQVNSATHQNQQSVVNYVKPGKGVTHYQTEEETLVETAYDKNPDQLEYMLGNLQADMSRQGVNTVQKGSCNACDKPIVGQVITALGKTWHPEHFTCNHCNQELGTRNCTATRDFLTI